MYVVFHCLSCSKLLYAREKQKTITCPVCQKRTVIQKAQKIARSESPKNAMEYVKKIERDKKVS